jgi:hypothetical protein
VAIHVLSGLPMEQPIIMADEVGYLGNARYLSGTAHLPDMWRSHFYHFGYSLFLLPAFWLFSNPLVTYKAVIAINALLMSALYFPLCSILGSFLDVPRGTARWIAFTCCLYPPLILYSDFAWSENAFVPAYALTIALFGRYLASPSVGKALLFGALVGFGYTIHPRALPVLAIVLAHLLALALLKIVPRRQALASAASMGLVFAVTRVLNQHLKAIGWGGGGEFSVAAMGGRLLPGRDPTLLIERASGQLLYLAQASHGLFLLGVAATVWLVLRRARSGSLRRILAEPETGVPIFALATASGVFLASVASKLYGIHGWESIRPTTLIHGRYNEALAVVFTAVALAELCRRGGRRRRLAWGALVVAAAILCLTAVVAAEIVDAQQRQAAGAAGAPGGEPVLPSEVRGNHVPGVYPLIRLFGELDLYAISLAVIASFLTVMALMRFSGRAGMVLLTALFAAFSLDNHRHLVVPRQAEARPRLVFASQISRLGPIDSMSYDGAHFEIEVFYGLQYLLPHTRFDRFDSLRGERPESEAVVSANRWGQARRLGARFVVSSGWDNALWLLPGELQTRLSLPSYEGVVLGVEPIFGVQESGFHLPEEFGGVPGRWTERMATLRVPLDPGSPPRILGIETVVPGRDGAQLELLANGVELWRGPIPSRAWSKAFDLEQVPMGRELLIKLKTDPASTASGTGSAPARRLGVVVRGIHLAASDSLGVYEGVTLGAESVLGFEDSGFHLPETFDGAPGRWTDGSATLRVPLRGRKPPRRLAVETLAPGRDGARLQVRANGVELWRGRIPSELWSRTFGLEQVPLGDELLIELESDTFVPAESLPKSRDTRRLGVVVRGVRLTAGESFEK